MLSKQGHTTRKRLEFLKLISRIDNKIKIKPRLQLGAGKSFERTNFLPAQLVCKFNTVQIC